MTIARPELPAFSFASVVKSRHLNNLAKARYSASQVLAHPRRSATRHASSIRPLGRRELTSAAANLSRARLASSPEISLRQRNSGTTHTASDPPTQPSPPSPPPTLFT